MEVNNLRKKRPTLNDFEQFIKEFREYKNNCNEKHKYKEWVTIKLPRSSSLHQ